MGFIIGLLAILLVLFMVLAMAVAEWADRDLVEWVLSFFNRAPKTAIQAAEAASVSAGTGIRMEKKPRRPAVKKRASGRPAAKK